MRSLVRSAAGGIKSLWPLANRSGLRGLFALALLGVSIPGFAVKDEGPEPTTLETVTVTGPSFVAFPTYTGWRGGEPGFPGSGSRGRGFVHNPGVDVGNRDAGTVKECKGNPVLISTGNKIEPEFDFSSSGERGLYLGRTYNHYWQGAGLFGKHWISNFDYKLTFGSTAINSCYPRPGGGSCGIGSSTVIYAWRPDGRVIKFVKKASNGVFYEDKPSPVARIERRADGSFVHFTESNENEAYSSAGYVTSIKKYNVGWTFAYTGGTYPYRVTHTSGRYVQFTWVNGQLTAVRDPAGNQYGFSYHANKFGAGLHRLASSSRPGSPATTVTYHYELASDPTALTGKSFNGARYSTFTYDANGYATSTQHNGADKYSFSYTPDADGKLTVVETNPLGKNTKYVFKDGKQASATGYPSTYCPGTMISLAEYDANGYLKMTSDSKGNRTLYNFNAKGQLLNKIEAENTPEARTTTYEWSTDNRLLGETVVGISKTSYDYDPIERPSRMRIQNLSANGVANQTHETRYQTTDYGQAGPNGMIMPGMLKSVVSYGPVTSSSNARTVSYDAAGNLTSITHAPGIVTKYSNHNGLGQPGKVTGPNGGVTEYTYDARGRIVRVRTRFNGVAKDTTYAYNGAGLLSRMTSADGRSISYQYDNAHRLIVESERLSANKYAVSSRDYNSASQVAATYVAENSYVPNTRIKGNIDGVINSGSGNYTLKGWACSTYMDESINVHFYAGGPAGGGGVAVAGFAASLASESAVAAQCDARGTAYRFNFPLTTAIRQAHGGKKIYLHGISPTGSGSNNLTLNRSGSFTIPGIGGGGPFPDPNPCPRPDGLPCTIEPLVPQSMTVELGEASTLGAPPGMVSYSAFTDYDELGRVRA